MISTDRKIKAQDSEPIKNSRQNSIGIVILTGLFVSLSVILLSTNVMKQIHVFSSNQLTPSRQKKTVPVIFDTAQQQSNDKKRELYLTTRCLADHTELPASLLELGKSESITIQLSQDSCRQITCGPFTDSAHMSRWHEIISKSINLSPEIFVK